MGDPDCPMKEFALSIPENQFAVVRDRERNSIVSSGRYEHCTSLADHMNREYQSTAYVAELWTPR